MRDATNSKVASTGGEPANRSQQPEEQSGIQLGKGRDVLKAKGNVRADTFRTYRYVVDRSPRRISRKGICRDLIGDMLDSYPSPAIP